MKRHGGLFEKFCSFENLLEAARKAQLGKRYQTTVSRFNFTVEQELFRLQKELVADTYHCGTYTNFYIYEPKQRYISAAPYRDRIIHQAICQVIAPIFEATFIADLYSNRVGKGTHRAADYYQKNCRLNAYVLKCDISKYFSSVDKLILFKLI